MGSVTLLLGEAEAALPTQFLPQPGLHSEVCQRSEARGEFAQSAYPRSFVLLFLGFPTFVTLMRQNGAIGARDPDDGRAAAIEGVNAEMLMTRKCW